MRWDLNRQAKAFLICLGIPWALVLLAAILLVALSMLAWLGVIETFHDG
jgi:hypothetical protein